MLPYVPILEPIIGVKECSDLGHVTILDIWGEGKGPTSPGLMVGKRIFKEN